MNDGMYAYEDWSHVIGVFTEYNGITVQDWEEAKHETSWSCLRFGSREQCLSIACACLSLAMVSYTCSMNRKWSKVKLSLRCPSHWIG